MRIVNLLFNFKKSQNNNKILGVERCFIDYAKTLTKQGATVLSTTKKNMIFGKVLKDLKLPLLELHAFNQGDIFSILRLAFELFCFKPDVAICHSGRALVFARMARLFLFKKFPIIAIDHGINPKKFLAADYVLVVNSYFRKQVVLAGMPENRALVIPNMVEIPQNFVLPKKSEFQQKIRLGSLGRLNLEKCFDKVIIALKLLKDAGIEASFVVGGVGNQQQELLDLAKKLGVEENFKILGWVEDKQKFFEEIDIFILPSAFETFGIVLLEAMLYNTPIITSNSWGPNEIIEDRIDGLKISADNQEVMPQLIADAVKNLTQNQEKARQMALVAHQKLLRSYESKVVAERLLTICETAIANYR